MEAQPKKRQYCRCLYLEAGMHIIAVLTFTSFGISLIAMPAAMPFAIIYLVHCISFVLIAFFNEKVWNRLLFFVFYVASTIAELSVGIVWSKRIHDEMTANRIETLEQEELDKFSSNFLVMTICCITAWAAARIFCLITLWKYFEDLRDGGV